MKTRESKNKKETLQNAVQLLFVFDIIDFILDFRVWIMYCKILVTHN